MLTIVKMMAMPMPNTMTRTTLSIGLIALLMVWSIAAIVLLLVTTLYTSGECLKASVTAASMPGTVFTRTML